jgi:outer membrane protein
MFFMKKIVYAVIVAAMVALTVTPLAFSADAKIGTVDSTRVLMESKSGKGAFKSIETMFNDKQAQFDLRQQEIVNQMEELDKKSMVISPDQKKQKQDKLQKDVRDLQRFKEDSEMDLNAKRDEILNNMGVEVKEILKSYGKQEGYTLILERGVVLYAPEAVDITDKIIDAYDRSKGIN